MVAPPAVDPVTVAPGVYTLAAVDDQPLPVETTRTANERDTLVADTLRLSGRIDSSVIRTRFLHYVAIGGIGAGQHQGTFTEYDGGRRVRNVTGSGR
ncbi:hypothetical protein tb265_10830 [Gemmatimonadetes bacterium T265]|nr:hypothetical protein tb265_10830 [Gemmatimonadetes bacterium T265]